MGDKQGDIFMPGTPIADLIEGLFERGLSPGDIVKTVRATELAIARGSGYREHQRKIWREKKQRQRGKKAENVPGDRKPVYIDSKSQSQNEIKKERKESDLFGVPEDKPVADDWPKDYRERFWSQVPRKVEKAAALRELDKVRKQRVPWAKFWAGVLRWNAESQTKEPRFVKHPTTWLRKGCWEDEQAPQGQNGGERSSTSRRSGNAFARMLADTLTTGEDDGNETNRQRAGAFANDGAHDDIIEHRALPHSG